MYTPGAIVNEFPEKSLYEKRIQLMLACHDGGTAWRMAGNQRDSCAKIKRKIDPSSSGCRTLIKREEDCHLLGFKYKTIYPIASECGFASYSSEHLPRR
jgi:hypothetical protein